MHKSLEVLGISYLFIGVLVKLDTSTELINIFNSLAPLVVGGAVGSAIADFICEA